MANLSETPNYDAGIYQIETTDPVLGGPSGIANAQAKALANRTAWLKQQMEQINSGVLTPSWIASQAYVQGELQKLDSKQSVRAATVQDLTLSGAQTVDGVALAVGDRVLVKDQTSASQNGIYLVAAAAWMRAADADSGTKLTSVSRIAIEEGTINAGKVWYLATAGAISIGSTALLFKDEHPAATQQQPGVARFATQAEAIAGALDSVAVAPKEMKAAINAHYLAAGTPLPAADIGPIWHDDYNDWMTWREFTANGANYTGYASRLIGSLLLDTQPTPRAGYIKSGVQNLSRTTYAALRAWAQHNGIMVAPGVWAAGTIQCADNADGITFRIYDVRGEFMRAWDDGRGVDAGRGIFSSQAGTIIGVDWSSDSSTTATLTTSTANDVSGFSGDPAPTTAALQTQTITTALTVVKGNVDSGKAVVARPRNTALLAAIKF